MQAIIQAGNGGPEVLHLGKVNIPTPSANQVLIEVYAAGINRPDCLQRAGHYPPPPDASPILGLEVAGRIAAIGTNVTQWKIDDNVVALLTGGGYAEFALAQADCCLPLPHTLNWVEAASLPETAFTVWSNLFLRGKLKAGETLLVHGGSSGIGVMAIQMAKAFGATVIITAGTREKCDFCKTLGADHAINYHTENFVDATLQYTQNRGVDLVLDMVGGDYLAQNMQLMAPEARLVQIAFLSNAKASLDLQILMQKRLTITGSTLRARTPEFKALIAKDLLYYIWPMLESGQIKPIIFKTFSLKEASQAHALMESHMHIGKIILLVKS